jgi:putative FmdB family regulatory protein
MPIYEYLCPECDSRFEELRPLSQAEDPVECPRCHHPAHRKMSTFACFSTAENGLSRTVPGTGGPCSGCSSGNCSTCSS